jgi:amidase
MSKHLTVSQDLSLSEIPSLVGITLQQIATGLDSERFTTEMLVTAYLARITEVNDEFRAIIELNGNALNEARELDKLRRVSGRLR